MQPFRPVATSPARTTDRATDRATDRTTDRTATRTTDPHPERRVRSDDEAECREYISTRLDHLRRVAYLLCQDWHAAGDLVSTVLLKLFTSWRRARRADNLDAYVRGMLTNAWLDERRRPWRRERPEAEVPERPAPEADHPDGHELGALLRTLGPRQRAVVVLRFHCDMSVEQTDPRPVHPRAVDGDRA